MAHQVQSKVKVMLTVFFDQKGIVHHKYAPEGQTANKKYYVEVLRWLCDVVWWYGASELRHESEMTGSSTQHSVHLSNIIHNVLAKLHIPHVLQPQFTGHCAV